MPTEHFNTMGANSLLGAPLRLTLAAAAAAKEFGANVVWRSRLFSRERSTSPNRSICWYSSRALAPVCRARLRTSAFGTLDKNDGLMPVIFLTQLFWKPSRRR
eukprot:5501576-Pyramimonas_sp.AAC.1